MQITGKEKREQRFIRVGRACNFKCKFCNISEYNESRYPLLQEQQTLKKEVDQAKKDAQEKQIEITISGGEPSLFPDHVKYILQEIDKELPIEIQTNASKIDAEFAYMLAQGGVKTALVSFHAVTKDIFEDVLDTPYAELENICIGMYNLLEAGISVMPNIVVTKKNLEDLLPVIHFLLKEFPSLQTYNLGVFQPHGEGEKNQAELHVPLQKVRPHFEKAINLLEKEEKTICFHYCSLPPCFFKKSQKKYVLEYHNYHHFRKQGLSVDDLKKSETIINAGQKYHPQICNFCYEKNFCGGIWKEVDKDEVKPEFITFKDF